MTGARLHVADRNGRRVVAIDKSPFTIGRGAESDLRLAGGEVSRDHAEIVHDGNRFLLRDRGSRYGTFVGGEMVTERLLVEGDRIRLGRSSAIELVFLQESDAAQPNGESLVEAVRQTAALLEGLRALGAGHLLNDVLILVLDAAIAAAGADRGFILLASKDGQLESTLGRGRGRIALAADAVISRKIPDEVFATGEPRMLTDVVDDDAAAAHGATLALGIRQVLCVPLRVTRFLEHGAAAPEPTRIGVLYLDTREAGSGLLSEAIRFGVETLATEAAVAIENARLYREAVEKARVDQELRVAADVQKALRPPARYRTAAFELAAASRASRSIGGDFFHYLLLPDGAFAFALGDVAGKGPPAAVLAAAVEGMFAAYSEALRGPADMLTRMNATLTRHFAAERFVTMVLGVLEQDGRLTYSNAGHNPPMLFGGASVRRLTEGGVPLGLFPDARHDQETLQLEAGSVLVLFSDGVTETTAADGAYFGDEGVLASVAAARDRRAEPLLEHLLATLEAFRGGGVPDDDVTCVIIEYSADHGDRVPPQR